MYRSIERFLKDESGSVTIEYGLIGAGIVFAFVAVLTGLAVELRHVLSSSKQDAKNLDKPSR